MTAVAELRGGAIDAAEIRAALTGARPVPHHPRVSVLTVGGRALVAKRARGGARGGPGLRDEERATRAAARVTVPGAGPLTAEPVYADAGIMIVDDLVGTRSLHAILLERRDPGAAAACGTALAHLHASPPPAGLSRCRPERPRLFPLTPQEYGRTPDGVLAILRWLERYPGVCEALGRAQRRDRSAEHFVHGDFKPDNLLITRAPEVPAVHVIDWELAGCGDPVEDLAALSAGLFAVALQSRVAVTDSPTPPALRGAVDRAAADTFAFLGVFLAAYRAVRPMPAEPAELVGAMALRMLSRAQSTALLAGSVNVVATLLLGAVRGMLTDVERSAAGLVAATDGGARC